MQRLTTARSCAVSTAPDLMACKALRVTSGTDSLAPSARSAHPAAIPSGYGPSELHSARLRLSDASGTVLANGLALLGVPDPDRR